MRAFAVAFLAAAVVAAASVDEGAAADRGRIVDIAMSNLTQIVERHPLLVVRVCATVRAGSRLRTHVKRAPR